MVTLHQYDYLFAIGTIFAFLDAWNIGANDVANSFATSVSSRSLTMKQAMLIATCMEFAGSMAVGARVSETIRTKIITTKLFEQEPSLLMLGMVCAVIGSSIYLTAATKMGLPVSTTHSIMGGVIGVGIAAIGVDGINWGWSGVSQVFAAWAIAPGIAGAFGAIIFLITKYGVMLRRNPVKSAFITVPVYFGITSGLLTMLIVWKGASSQIKLSDAECAGVIVGVAVGVALLVCVFFLPYLHRKLVLGDWQLKWWHVIQGPLLLKRGEVPPCPEGVSEIEDFYRGHLTREELEAKRAQEGNSNDVEAHPNVLSSTEKDSTSSNVVASNPPGESALANARQPPPGPWYAPAVMFYWAKRAFFRGVEKDVVSAQSKSNILTGNIEEMHARVSHYDNKAEYMYSFLQILTAATSSFTHGANDVSNAVGPYATIFLIWHTNHLSDKVPVPTWILAFGGGAIVIGLWTYGYNIMRNLGNRITLHSPSRGFSMELGSAITVIMATRLKLPISTTQCITGATVGVGLCNGDWRTINWRMVAWIYMGWFITLPVAGIISGCLMGIIINAPQWGNST
ncbi:putative phosphate-repressible Na+/phosphate cotransporter Pho89 [Glonium stellatum]|uniref:Phosphate transporter n=1 Tax=Glonium stellatum TaxID=574774 RepID=A0A8E2FDJ6_9PEZI|nr:putative phosphate-repressible Na+/phosphate cotransporter Pho89 [Glonium stellatum]